MDTSNRTSKDGHFKLEIKGWTIQIGHQRMDTSNRTSKDGNFKIDINE